MSFTRVGTPIARLVLAFVFVGLAIWNIGERELVITEVGPADLIALSAVSIVVCHLLFYRFLDKYDVTFVRRIVFSIVAFFLFHLVYAGICFVITFISLQIETELALIVEHTTTWAVSKTGVLALAYFFANLLAFDYKKIRGS